MGSFTLALYSDPILLRAYNCYDAQQVRRDRIVKNKWQPIDIKEEGGLLRERVSPMAQSPPLVHRGVRVSYRWL